MYFLRLIPVYQELKRISELHANLSRKMSIIDRILQLSLTQKIELIKLVNQAYSELGQELIILLLTDFKRNGCFVEIGASDGIECSNTKLLEENYNWHGLLVEPNPIHRQMLSNRKAFKNFNAVSKSNGFVYFNQSGSLSYTSHNKNKNAQLITTVTLDSVLSHYFDPQKTIIDFISIDIEGSELDVLSNFEFSKWTIKYFFVEHNYKNEELLDKLMNSYGYVRFLSKWSNQDAYYHHMSETKKVSKYFK